MERCAWCRFAGFRVYGPVREIVIHESGIIRAQVSDTCKALRLCLVYVYGRGRLYGFAVLFPPFLCFYYFRFCCHALKSFLELFTDEQVMIMVNCLYQFGGYIRVEAHTIL